MDLSTFLITFIAPFLGFILSIAIIIGFFRIVGDVRKIRNYISSQEGRPTLAQDFKESTELTDTTEEKSDEPVNPSDKGYYSSEAYKAKMRFHK